MRVPSILSYGVLRFHRSRSFAGEHPCGISNRQVFGERSFSFASRLAGDEDYRRSRQVCFSRERGARKRPAARCKCIGVIISTLHEWGAKRAGNGFVVYFAATPGHHSARSQAEFVQLRPLELFRPFRLLFSFARRETTRWKWKSRGETRRYLRTLFFVLSFSPRAEQRVLGKNGNSPSGDESSMINVAQILPKEQFVAALLCARVTEDRSG